MRRLTPAKRHSPADDEAEGFNPEELSKLAEQHGLKLVELEPVWFLIGGVYMVLETAYRLFRLHRRFNLPGPLERAILRLDRGLVKVPGLRSCAWHYSAFYLKA